MRRTLVVGLMGLFLSITGVAKGQVLMIENGRQVKFDYSLTVDGKVADTSAGKEPLEYTQGGGQIIKGLEAQMLGLKVGDEKTIIVKPEEGYGPLMPDAVQAFPKSFFPKDFMLTVGMVVPLQNNEGAVFPATVKEIKADEVLLDLNHPLAGKELTFAVKIVEIK